MAAWGKLDRSTSRQLSLISHCCDVAAVFEAILRYSPVVRRRLATAGGLDDLNNIQITRLTVIVFLHDLGKCNRGFQNHQYRGREPKKPTAGHIREALVLLDNDRCTDRFSELIKWEAIDSWGDSVLSIFLADLSHHGDPVNLINVNSEDAKWWDEQAWADLGDVIRFAQEQWPGAWAANESPFPTSPRFQHMFAGVAALADWIGSDRGFFPVDRREQDSLPWSRRQAKQAVREIGIAYGRVPITSPDTFVKAFGFAPRPAQAMSATVPLDQIIIVEDETGSGKTEAALWIWRRLHDAGLVDGFYFALPTRSAGTQLHKRVQKNIRTGLWTNEAPACVLAVPGYIRVDDREGRKLPNFEVLWDDAAKGAERHRRWAAEWPRRYLAAYNAVGTIDQALLSGLRVTHSSQRAAALSRSALIVDELHASDAYMGQILLRVVENHVACGGYIIALSATLGASLRARLLNQDLPTYVDAVAVAYPAIHVNGEIFPIKTKGNKQVLVSRESANNFIPLIHRALSDDAAVLVIRNTVVDAVETFKELENFGVDAILHHSRYGVEDRRELDRRVEVALGKRRRKGAICVIGTQTLEQSLDIDADVLITDLCPMDVLLQRIGRLHRHLRRGRPVPWNVPRAFVLAPADGMEPLLAKPKVQGLGLIYPDLRICQLTLEQIEDRGRFNIPKDCRQLIELTTHPERLEKCSDRSKAWQKHGQRMDGEGYADQSVADQSCISRTNDWRAGIRLFSGWENDEDIKTRLGVRDCRVEVDWRGAFVDRITAVNVPGRWILGIDYDDVQPAGVWQIRAGRVSFSYGRYGLQRR